MEIAEVTTTGTVYEAHEFRDLVESERAELRAHLICVSCRADAYYIRPSRNGRPACFGARPHNEPCEQASQSTERLTVEELSESEQRAARSGGFRLQAADGTPVSHNQIDDPPGRRQRGGHAYTQGDGSRSGSLPGLKLDRLLRLLVSKPGFAESASPLHLDSGTITSVREYCVPIGAVDVSFRGRERIYWGTIRFPVVDDDGAWLNTGSRAEPSVRINSEHLDALIDRWQLASPDDLVGAAFATWSKLRLGSKMPPKMLMFAESLSTFVVIPESRIHAATGT